MKADFPAQVQARVRELAGETGADIEMILMPAGQDKTRAQESGFHAMVSPWARERGWAIDALKQFLLKKIFGTHDFVDFTTGEVFQVLAEPHTSKLTKVQYSELIEQAMVLAAEDNFYLIAPDEWRKMKEDAAKQAAREAKKAGRAA
jgi:hypothetical protein